MVDKFEKNLKTNNINIKCNATLFNLHRVYFLNSTYHLNKYRSIIRTEILADCVNNILNKTYKKMSYKDAIKKTNKLKRRYYEQVKKPKFKIKLVDF